MKYYKNRKYKKRGGIKERIVGMGCNIHHIKVLEKKVASRANKACDAELLFVIFVANDVFEREFVISLLFTHP